MIAAALLRVLSCLVVCWAVGFTVGRCVEHGLPYAAASVAWCFVVWVMDGSPIVGRA